MRRLGLAILLMCGIVFAAERAVAPEFFKYSREVNVGDPSRQAYFVIDQVMWEHMREDLGDLRLFAGSTQVPYSLEVQRGGVSTQYTPAKMFDLGESGGRTTFKLEAPVEEYDSITLDLGTRNFVTETTVEGSDDGANWTRLSAGTIFDFTDEKLGANLDVRLASPARFRRLRLAIADHVRAKDVRGARMALLQEQVATWSTIPAQPQIKQDGRETIIEWDSPSIPLERVQLSIGEPGLNFSRTARLEDSEGRVIATGEIARVHLRRGGTSIDREELGINVASGPRSKHYKLTIENGDDRPLPIAAVQPLSYERRVYIDPQGKANVTLYFGEEKTEPPQYDFARFFQQDPAAVRASLDASQPNPSHKDRPDDRPWSERNQWVLWVVLVVAVLGLAVVAVRSMAKKTA